MRSEIDLERPNAVFEITVSEGLMNRMQLDIGMRNVLSGICSDIRFKIQEIPFNRKAHDNLSNQFRSISNIV